MRIVPRARVDPGASRASCACSHPRASAHGVKRRVVGVVPRANPRWNQRPCVAVYASLDTNVPSNGSWTSRATRNVAVFAISDEGKTENGGSSADLDKRTFGSWSDSRDFSSESYDRTRDDDDGSEETGKRKPNGGSVDGTAGAIGEVPKPKAVLSEQELLPPSKREPRGKETKGEGEGERVGGKETGEGGEDGKIVAGTTKAGMAAKTKPKTDVEKSGEKLAAPKHAPPPSGGSIKSAVAGIAEDTDLVASSGDIGGGNGGDDARSGGDGGGGDDEEDDEEGDDEDDDEVVLRTPWYELAWIEMETELVRIMQQILNIWITRDPSKTTRLVFFSLLGTSLFLASLFLYPENPLEFSDEGLFASVFGRNPRWVINRELGPLQPTLLSTTCACAVAFAKVRLGANMFKLSPFMHGVLGLPMGFMLVFRWNNAHERWWYGRTCLGNILLYCKNLGGTFCTWVAPDDPMLAARALGLIGALKETVADRLNGTVLNDGAILSQLTTPLDARDLEGLFLADNKVLFCIEALRSCVVEAFKKDFVPSAIASTIHSEVAAIMDNYGSCEKVVNQPPPGCIITHLKSTLMVYVCSLPMILVHEVGVWGVVPVTTILSLALFGIEAAAEQIEQPFGNRPYDLPVRALMNSNSRDLEQTSKKVLGMAGYVNGVKMAFTADGPVPAKLPDKTTTSALGDEAPAPVPAPVPSAIPAPVPVKPTVVQPPPPVPSASALAEKAKKAAEPESPTAVVIPATRKDNTVSLSSDRLEMGMSALKESPLSFTSDSTPTSSDVLKKSASQSPISNGDNVSSRPSTSASAGATGTVSAPSKGAFRAVLDAVSSEQAPVNIRAQPLSPLRTTRSEATSPARKSDLPAWKAQSPIEIYDQVLDERPSSTIPDSPRYHTQKTMRRRDSYGQQFFDMFARYTGGSSENRAPDSPQNPSRLERSNSARMTRSSSAATFSPFTQASDSDRDVGDISFQRSAFAPSPSKSDFVAGSGENGVPIRRASIPGGVNRSTSLTDMSALEEAIKRAREARKRGESGGGASL